MKEMGTKKFKAKTSDDDVGALKSEVASFASSIGLSTSGAPSSGFDDSDFRKKGPLKPRPQKPHNGNRSPLNKRDKPKNNQQVTDTNRIKSDSRPKPKPGFQLENYGSKFATEKFKNLPKLPLVKASALGVWYVDAAELEEKVLGGPEAKKKVEIKNLEEWKAVVEKKKEQGERLLAQYARDYETSRGQSGDIKMLIATQRSGTAVDKVSAFSVMVGDNTVANIRSLDVLLGMVTSKIGKRHALTAFEVLKELFVSSLLPDRKLKTLFQRPLNLLPETKDGYSLLLFWYWEECLKERYECFVSAIEEASRDVLAILKDKALKTIYTLLKSKPEQERRLLSALVNKLGDPGKKAASNADFHLSKLLADHPSMKAVVIDEVDNFLFRPHLGLQAKFYAVNFLSQIRLSHKGDGPKVAKRLIEVYFALFKVLISDANREHGTDKCSKEKTRKISSSKCNPKNAPPESHVEMDSRLLTALLTGVNRAFPFVSSDESDKIIETQTPILFQLVHSRSFNVGVQALMLLDKITTRNQIVSDRFYRALYSKLLLPAAMNSSKEEMFIGLLLRAMKNDINLRRIAAFSKRLLQVALQQPPQYACGCLFLLSEVLKARPPLWNIVLQNELIDEDFEHFEDVPEDDEYAANPKQNEMVESANAQGGANIDMDSDALPSEDGSAPSDSEGKVSDDANDLLLEGGQRQLQGSKPMADGSGLASEVTTIRTTSPGGYSPRHREPLYCNADRASWWELRVLASHVHPSVATMANTLLSGANIVYNGNPLSDLSLTAFLDKFIEKKPKQSTWHGASEIEPTKKLDTNNLLIGPEILSLAESDVPPEDLVFHRFYTNKMHSSNKPKKKKKKKKGAEDETAEELYAVDGEDDESDNEAIENMLDSSNPPLENDGEYDYDDLDNIANEDDDELIGQVSDGEPDLPSHVAGGELEGSEISGWEDDDGVEVGLGEADDGCSDEDSFDERRRRGKSKSRRNASASPFASMEEYEHLIINDGSPETEVPNQKKHVSTKKKRRTSK
nr:CCAAT/enhancer-binding protein zeta-like [Coffea arabica]